MEANFLTEVRGHFPRTPQERIILCGEASGSAHRNTEGIHARQVTTKEQGCWKQFTIVSMSYSEGPDPTSAYWVEQTSEPWLAPRYLLGGCENLWAGSVWSGSFFRRGDMVLALKGKKTQGVSRFPAWGRCLVKTLKSAEVWKRISDNCASSYQAIERWPFGCKNI